MSSDSLDGLVLTEWRSRLIARHPELFPDAKPVQNEDGWKLSAAGWPAVPDGWRRVVERACERLGQAVMSKTGIITIGDVREKYGQLRIDIATLDLSADTQAAVERAVDLAEAASAHTCSRCGERGRAWSDGGWLDTLCDLHGIGAPVPRRPGDDIEVIGSWQDGRMVKAARRYLPDENRFVPAPFPGEE